MNRAALTLGLVVAVACHDAASEPPATTSTAPVVPAPPSAKPSAAPAASSRPLAWFKPEKVTAEDHAMGTHLSYAAFTAPDVDEGAVHRAFDAATQEIRRLEALMTTWRPDSEVSRVNAAAGQSPVVVSQETYDVIAESIRASERSDGAFDITFETLHGLWKFDQDLDPHPPSDADVAARLPFVGYRRIKLDATKRTVYLDDAKTKIGLGGIAKGYAVDAAAKVLGAAGIANYFVQAGGDLFTHGKKPDGTDWMAGVRDPRGQDGDYFVMLPVTDHAFSTAGDYERSYIVSGKRYHHIIDPRTGKPATASRSVTIWAPTALLADEIDDAVFILGPERGLSIVEAVDGVGAVIVDAHNRVWISKRLEGKVVNVHPPTDGI